MEELLARVAYLENIVSKLAKWTHFSEIVHFGRKNLFPLLLIIFIHLFWPKTGTNPARACLCT